MKMFDFGPFAPYVEDDDITDINYNGRQLWIDHLKRGRYVEEEFVCHKSIEQFCYRFANHSNHSFNVSHPIIETETKDLRFSILHDSISKSGCSVSIRKTPAVMRLKKDIMIDSNYASQEILQLFQKLIQARCNILVCGLPGAGKTELVKYLTSFIPGHQRVITIEDTLEIRYGEIHPEKDSVSLKVHQRFPYTDAIKASLRQRPDWLLLSEVRSHEVVQLMESVSTGAKLISTLHADNAKSIPVRLLHMFPGVELSNEVLLQNIYQNIDVGIHVESMITDDGISRCVKEIVCFDVNPNGGPEQHVLYHKVLMPQIAQLPAFIEQKWLSTQGGPSQKSKQNEKVIKQKKEKREKTNRKEIEEHKQGKNDKKKEEIRDEEKTYSMERSGSRRTAAASKAKEAAKEHSSQAESTKRRTVSGVLSERG